VLRVFGGLLGNHAGWQLDWLGGSLRTIALLLFTAVACHPGVCQRACPV